VVCVFGIFFLPDMSAALASLWRLVRPGGVLAVTTWGPRLFEPASGAFWEAVRDERPDLVRGFNQWDLVVTPESLAQLFVTAGVAPVSVEPESATHPLRSTDDWWTIALGTGYRATIDALGSEAAARVRAANLAAIGGVRELETHVIYAAARKPTS